MAEARERIWELDALRGIAILCVVILHFLFDLRTFCGSELLENPLLHGIMQYGGTMFVVLSGLCVTLGHHSLRRGIITFGCGMAITAVTLVMVRIGMAEESVVIRFGVLHLLGICMMLWCVLKRLPPVWLGIAGAGMVSVGYWFMQISVQIGWLFPLGLTTETFVSADFFPLFPYLGWFLLGSVLGKTVYGNKKSLFSQKRPQNWIFTCFCWCGTHSLWIYLIHQPILYVVFLLFA